jgi:hypothetical protein
MQLHNSQTILQLLPIFILVDANVANTILFRDDHKFKLGREKKTILK